MNVKLQDNNIEVTVSSAGAEVISVIYKGVERVWQNDNGAWSGHAPVLFPYCGNCKVMLGGVEYKGAAHGFARKSEFKLIKQSFNSVKFALCSSPLTKAYYPYDFTLEVCYTLSGSSLTVAYTVINPSDSVLPFSCGGHESFALGRDVGEYSLRFEHKEHLVHYYHDPDSGLLNGQTYDWGTGEYFKLPADFLTEGKTLIFPAIKSRKVTLTDGGGETVAVSEFADFNNLLLWRPDGGRTVCIEPWGNLPVIADFNSLAPFNVRPHDKLTITRKITYGEHI